MPRMAETKIMTLGRVGELQPMMPAPDWLQVRRVTPQQPQNLLRAVMLHGVHRTAGVLSGLGAVGDQVLNSVTGQEPVLLASGDAGMVPLAPAGDPVAMNLSQFPRWPWQKQPIAVQIGTIVAGASLSLVSAAVSGYHGYRRDRSVMAGVGWAFMGMLIPVITPVVAFAQGYARPRGRR